MKRFVILEHKEYPYYTIYDTKVNRTTMPDSSILVCLELAKFLEDDPRIQRVNIQFFMDRYPMYSLTGMECDSIEEFKEIYPDYCI